MKDLVKVSVMRMCLDGLMATSDVSLYHTTIFLTSLHYAYSRA